MIGNRQSEGRILSQEEVQTVQYIDIITKGTIEEAVYNKTGDKEELLQELVQDPGWVRKLLIT